MPRANRYVVPGHIYHLTHRCHDRQFLLRFAKDRNGYRRRLREAVLKTKTSLLSYNITSNHVHLLAWTDEPTQIATLMQEAAGQFASDYNRRKHRSGAFWEGRYQATMVDSGEYLWNCLKYVELNMVRCGVVAHPGQWEWSGYGELMGWRKRNRLLDLEKLLGLLRCSQVGEFRAQFDAALNQALVNRELERQAQWSEAIAVGRVAYVQAIEEQIRWRQRMGVQEQGGAWVLQEEHGPVFEPEKRAMSAF
jgi:REP-associated tyrosine transposase